MKSLILLFYFFAGISVQADTAMPECKYLGFVKEDVSSSSGVCASKNGGGYLIPYTYHVVGTNNVKVNVAPACMQKGFNNPKFIEGIKAVSDTMSQLAGKGVCQIKPQDCSIGLQTFINNYDPHHTAIEGSYGYLKIGCVDCTEDQQWPSHVTITSSSYDSRGNGSYRYPYGPNFDEMDFGSVSVSGSGHHDENRVISILMNLKDSLNLLVTAGICKPVAVGPCSVYSMSYIGTTAHTYVSSNLISGKIAYWTPDDLLPVLKNVGLCK